MNTEIAKYILTVLRMRANIVWSWGFSHPIALGESEEGEGGLLFNVDGFKFKGRVKIVLNWLDTFTVSLIDPHGKTTEVIDDVYIDNLISVIDNAVEHVPDYEKAVKLEYQLI